MKIGPLNIQCCTNGSTVFYAGIVSSGNACRERRFQSYNLTVGTAFKPALCELYKSTQFAPKFAYLRSKIENFSGEGAGLDSPSPHLTPLGASILPRTALKNSAHTAPRLPIPPFANPTAPLFVLGWGWLPLPKNPIPALGPSDLQPWPFGHRSLPLNPFTKIRLCSELNLF